MPGARTNIEDDGHVMELFERDWLTYSKVVKHNYMYHREVYTQLRRLLVGQMPRPFSFLDLGCGDASGSIEALKGTTIAAYRGIDLSGPALALARRGLAALGCPIALEQRDFADALAAQDQPADVIWIGQALHHFDVYKKLSVMREARRVCGSRGLFVIWEPTHLETEDQGGWLQRFQSTCQPLWTSLERREWTAMVEHIRHCDRAETDATWQALGKEAGFAHVQEVFTPPLNLNRMYCYRA